MWPVFHVPLVAAGACRISRFRHKTSGTKLGFSGIPHCTARCERISRQKMKIINLTPHAVSIVGEGGKEIASFPPSGQLARCSASTKRVGEISFSEGVSIPLTCTQLGAVEGLPSPQPDTCFIVSRIIAEACPDRTDLLFPDQTVRDGEGGIMGCKSLSILGGVWP